MGASISSNISKTVNEAIIRNTSNISQKKENKISQTQRLDIDTSGDIDIQNLDVTQKLLINTKSVLDTLSTNASKQKIINDVLQETKSLISGINIAQLAVSSNMLDNIVKGVSETLNTITQTCDTSVAQTQNVNIKSDKDIRLKNVTLSQFLDTISECSQQSILSNNSIQDAENKLKQLAASETKGISEWIILGMIASFGLPVAVVGVGAMFRLFPILIIVGICIIIYQQKTQTYELKTRIYSLPIKECCTDEKVDQNVKSAADAQSICTTTPSYKAFYWTPTSTFFYSNVNEDCFFKIPIDQTSLTEYEKIYVVKKLEDATETRKWMYTEDNRNLYKYDGTWQLVAKNVSITNFVPLKNPNSLAEDVQNGNILYLNENREKKIFPLQLKLNPTQPNVAGIKILPKSTLFRSGIAILVIGCIGTITSYNKK